MMTRLLEKCDADWQKFKENFKTLFEAKIAANGGKTNANIVEEMKTHLVNNIVDVANNASSHAESSTTSDDHVSNESAAQPESQSAPQSTEVPETQPNQMNETSVTP